MLFLLIKESLTMKFLNTIIHLGRRIMFMLCLGKNGLTPIHELKIKKAKLIQPLKFKEKKKKNHLTIWPPDRLMFIWLYKNIAFELFEMWIEPFWIICVYIRVDWWIQVASHRLNFIFYFFVKEIKLKVLMHC